MSESESGPVETIEKEETERIVKCRKCEKPARPLSAFCEDHQEQVVPRQRKRRIRRLDVILVVVLIFIIWGYPKAKRGVWKTLANYVERTAESADPRFLDAVNDFVARLIPEEYRHHGDAKRVVAVIRETLLGSTGTIPPSVDKILRDAEESGAPLSLDGAIERLESAEGEDLTEAQLADLRALRHRGGWPEAAPPAERGQRGRELPTTVADSVRAAAALVPSCGNGIVETHEQCDGQALAGATCVSLGFSGDCGTGEACIKPELRCLGNCTFDYSGCTAESHAALQRFIDHGNGTATDRLTGLMWELKCADDRCGERHEVLTTLPWHGAAAQWIDSLNQERFAGHGDWRLPSLEELRTLLTAVPPCPAEPCASAAWPRNQTAPASYWSSTTFSIDKQRAWVVSFRDGDVYTAEKRESLHARAVRRGH
jgi:hypothetical protein